MREKRFEVGNYIAEPHFCTEGSVGLRLVKYHTVDESGSKRVSFAQLADAPGALCAVQGWVDVHYPCSDHIRAVIRVSGPPGHWENDDTLSPDGEPGVWGFVAELFKGLGIPARETWRLSVVGEHRMIESPIDGRGHTNQT